MYQDKIFACKFSSVCKVLKIGIFGLSKRREKIHHLAIFLYFRVVICLPLSNTKGDFDASSRLSSRAILNYINSRQNLMAAVTRQRFAGFLENEIILETLPIVIFVNSSSKGFPWPNVKKFDSSVLTANSRYLQSAGLLINTNVETVLLYGADTWRVTKKNTDRVQAFVKRCLRYILGMRWPNAIRMKTCADEYTTRGCLRAAIRNFHLGPCKIEKSKIAKLCHNKGLPKPLIKI